MFIPERHLPTTPGQREHSSQRHTAAGTAAPTTTDKDNTVPQRANPTQTAYARPRTRAQASPPRQYPVYPPVSRLIRGQPRVNLAPPQGAANPASRNDAGLGPCGGVTETKKRSPNTGARANNTPQITRPPYRGAC